MNKQIVLLAVSTTHWGNPEKAISKYVKAIQVDNHDVVSITSQGFPP